MNYSDFFGSGCLISLLIFLLYITFSGRRVKALKTAEQLLSELKKRDERLREVLENSMDASYKRNIDSSHYEYLSPVFTDMTGYSIQEISTLSIERILELIHPEDVAEVNRVLASALTPSGNDSYQLEYRFKHKDGTYRWLIDRFKIIRNEVGNAVAFIGSVGDITLLKKTEESQYEGLERLRKIAERVPGVVYQFRRYPDGRFNFPFVSEALKDVLRVNPDEVNEDASNIFAAIHPHDRKTVFNSIKKSAEHLTLWQQEFRVKFQDGTIRSLYSSAIPEKEEDGSILWHGFTTDITKSKQVEEALRTSERTYRDIFHKNTAVKLLIDPESGAILTANKAAAQFYGYSTNALEQMNISDINLLSSEQVVTEMALAAAELRNYFNFRHRLASGEVRDVEVYSSPIYSEGRTLLYSIIHDISAHTKSEEALIRSQTFLNNIIEHSPNSLWISDENGRMIRMNQACRDTLSLKDEEVVGKYNIFEDNILQKQGLISQIKEVFKYGKRAQFPIFYDTAEIESLKLAQTKKLVLDVHISPILDRKGIVTNAIIQHIDITKQIEAEQFLRESEEKYRTVFSNEKDALVLIDKETFAILDVNESACRLYGYAEEELLKFYNYDISAEPEDTRRLTTEFKDRIELRFHKKSDGTVFPVDILASEFTLKSRPVILATIHDITERTKMDEAIKRKNEELQKVNAEKDKFFSIIAHDLRSPFNGFLGLTEILTTELSEMSMLEIKGISLMLNKSAVNLYKLIENLLEWSRMQRGLIDFDPKPLLLKPKISEYVALNYETACKKEIAFNIKIEDDLAIYADEYMAGSILRNLVTNALKFTPKGGIITISALPAGDNMVEISIRDTGIGMGKNMVDNLFRLDVNTSRKGTDGESSTGLGLIICKDFIEKNSGKLTVESEVGVGSVFRVSLPQTIW
jgi:PAS domain S-box-containing protein